MRSLGLVAALVLLPSCTVADECSASADGPLSQWLCDVAIGPLPDIVEAVTKVGVEVDVAIRNLTCTGFALGPLVASSGGNMPGSSPLLTVEADLRAFHCASSAQSGFEKPIPWSGVIGISLPSSGRPAKLRTTLELRMGKDGLAVGAQLRATSVALGDVQVSFGGLPQLLAWLPDLLERALSHTITKQVEDLLQGAISQSLDDAVAQLASELQPLLRPPVPSPEPPHVPADAILWRSSAARDAVSTFLNDAVGLEGPFGLNGLARRATGGSGEVTLRAANASLELPLWAGNMSLGSLGVELVSSSVRGLANTTRWSMMTAEARAADSHSLGFVWASSGLGVRAAVNVTVLLESELLSAPPLHEVVVLDAALERLGASTSLFVPLNSSTDVGRVLSDAGCLAAALLGTPSMRALDANLSVRHALISSAQGGTLENDLAALTNDVLAFAIDVTAPVLPRLVDGGAGGPLRRSLNQIVSRAIDAWRKRASCPPPPPPAPLPPLPEAIDWTSNDALRNLSKAVGEFGALGIDLLMRELTGGSGSARLNTSHTLLRNVSAGALGNVSVTLLDAAVDGLSNVQHVELLTPISPTELASRFQTSGLNLSAHLKLDSSAFGAVQFGGTLRARQISLGLTTRLALNASGPASLQLQQLANASCAAAQLLVEPTLTGVRASARSFNLTLWGDDFGSREPTSVVLPSASLSLTPGLTSLIKQSADQALASLISRLGPPQACIAPSPAPDDAVDFRSNSTSLARLMRAIHATLDPRTLNKLIDALTRRLGMPPGELDLPFGISLPELHDEKLGAVLVQLSRIKLRGLDQAFNLSLVGSDARDATLLHNTLGVGGSANDGRAGRTSVRGEHTTPLVAQMRLAVRINGVWDVFDLEASLASVLLLLDARLGIHPSRLLELPLGQLASHPASCSLMALDSASLSPSSHVEFAGRAAAATLRLTSPGTGVTTSINASHASAAARRWADAIAQVLNGKAHDALASASELCLHGPAPPPPPPPPPWLSAFDILLLVLGALLGLGLMVCWWRRHAKAPTRRATLAAAVNERLGSDGTDWMLLGTSTGTGTGTADTAQRTADHPALDMPPHAEAGPAAAAAPSGAAPEGVGGGAEATGEAACVDVCTRAGDLDARSLAMRHSPAARCLFSAGIVVAGALFGYAHANNGATMYAITSVAEAPVSLPNLFYFTLLNSVENEWNSGTYVLSLLVAIFSGLWPFLKLFAQLVLWWMPPAYLSVERMGLAARALDVSAKFAMTDNQMVILLMAALHFEISRSPEPSPSPGHPADGGAPL